MSIDPTTALIVTQLLSRYLAKYGEAFAGKLGEHTAEGVANIWKTIRDKFSGKKESEKALEEFSKSPNDEQSQKKFQEQLERAFADDPSFAGQLVPLIVGHSVYVTNTTTQINYFPPLAQPERTITLPLRDHKKFRRASGISPKYLIYQQDDFANTFDETGKPWNFWSGQIDNSSAFWIREGVVAVGGDGPNAVAVAQTPTPATADVYVDFEVQLKDVFSKPDNWAGIRLRGLTPYQEIGYLVYLRGTGSLELYRGTSKWDGGKLAISSPLNQWIRIRAECVKDKIKIWIGAKKTPHIERTDKWFGGDGYVYFHTWGAKAMFRNLKVYSCSQ